MVANCLFWSEVVHLNFEKLQSASPDRQESYMPVPFTRVLNSYRVFYSKLLYTWSGAPVDLSGAFFTCTHFQKITQIHPLLLRTFGSISTWPIQRIIITKKPVNNHLKILLVINILYTLYCKSIRTSAFLWCKMPMFCRAGVREGGKYTPTSISIFDFYSIKTLWFEFGNDIFTGNKMPTL